MSFQLGPTGEDGSFTGWDVSQSKTTDLQDSRVVLHFWFYKYQNFSWARVANTCKNLHCKTCCLALEPTIDSIKPARLCKCDCLLHHLQVLWPGGSISDSQVLVSLYIKWGNNYINLIGLFWRWNVTSVQTALFGSWDSKCSVNVGSYYSCFDFKYTIKLWNHAILTSLLLVYPRHKTGIMNPTITWLKFLISFIARHGQIHSCNLLLFVFLCNFHYLISYNYNYLMKL